MLPAPHPIDTLEELDRKLLYVFVAGPGQGEGIAIALPERDWIVIDACRAPFSRPPLLRVLERKRDDEDLAYAILTHPHDDHVDGFADVINAVPPKRIALAGAAGAPTYAALLQLVPLPTTTDEGLRASKLRAALAAVRAWELTHGAALALNAATTALPETGHVVVRVHAPEPVAMAAYLHRCIAEPEAIKAIANHFSLVLELRFGETRIVFGGDLPHMANSAIVPTGWSAVMAATPELCEHAGLKVPHHGSAEATSTQLMTVNSAQERVWLVTPYNSSKLPRVAEMDGLPELVRCNGSIQLTAIPASKHVQAVLAQPGRIPLAQLTSRVHGQSTGSRFVDSVGVEVTPGTAVDVLDTMWCIAFDDRGAVVARFRGNAAMDVVA